MDAIFITGANSSYFMMACMLMESIGAFAPMCSFAVLDFGLSDRERQFLRARNALIDMPGNIPGVSATSHPYFLKTAAIHYLNDISPSSTIVWVDSDIVLGSEIKESLYHVRREMEAVQSPIAACRECAIADILDSAQLDLGPFREIVKEKGVSSDRPYFNSGFVVFRSREILTNWFNLAVMTPLHALFDQNLLNVLIHKESAVTALPQEDWNLHGDLLVESTLEPLLRQGPLPKILHATSPQPDHVDAVSISFEQDFGRDYPLRFFRNPILRQHQFKLLTGFLQREFPESQRSTLSLGGRTKLKFSRNSACPCNSGKRYKFCHGSLT
jgi:hypothetical protein